MPEGRIQSAADIDDLHRAGHLSNAEIEFIKACVTGGQLIRDSNKKLEKTSDNFVRSKLIRFFALGGDQPYRTHHLGIFAIGCYIGDELDLSYVETTLPIVLRNCNIPDGLTAPYSRLGAVDLSNSDVLRVFAPLCHIHGIFNLSGVDCRRGVDLSQSIINGTVLCSGARIRPNDGRISINLHQSKISGDLYLDQDFYCLGVVAIYRSSIAGMIAIYNSTLQSIGAPSDDGGPDGVTIDGRWSSISEFRASDAVSNGMIVLDFATIQGGFDFRLSRMISSGRALKCEGTRFGSFVRLSNGLTAEGGASFIGSQIFGDFYCDGVNFRNPTGSAFDAQSIKVGSGFVWWSNKMEGAVDFTAGRAETFIDNPKDWSGNELLSLDGFTYDRLFRVGDAESRLRWLRTGARRGNNFNPQPYEHLASVLRSMGFLELRRTVLIEKETLLRKSERDKAHAGLDGTWPKAIESLRVDASFLWGLFLKYTVEYGYRPWRSFMIAFILVLMSYFLYSRAYDAGDMVPSSPVVLLSPEWQRTSSRESNPAVFWSERWGRDYETFAPFIYALDTFLPLVDFGQEAAWSPTTSRGEWGRWAFRLRWLIKISGWIIISLAAAALSGLLRKD